MARKRARTSTGSNTVPVPTAKAGVEEAAAVDVVDENAEKSVVHAVNGGRAAALGGQKEEALGGRDSTDGEADEEMESMASDIEDDDEDDDDSDPGTVPDFRKRLRRQRDKDRTAAAAANGSAAVAATAGDSTTAAAGEEEEGQSAAMEFASDGTYRNKQRVLLFSSRGITSRFRHLLGDLRKLIPHHKKVETSFWGALLLSLSACVACW
ncbi:unnamed protein product [Ectocarpus sp. 12 AP-2014]